MSDTVSRFLALYLRLVVIASLAGFLVGVILGPGLFYSVAKGKEYIISLLRTNPLAAMALIYLNNLLVSLVGLVPFLGLVILGANTAVLGSMASINILLLAYILPHGLIELPVIAYSIYLGGYIPAYRRAGGLRRGLVMAVRRWGLVVAPLLLLAAVIEVFITPMLLPS
ncbi:MAG: stage II sporulation protein M [Pyrodictiaceae archaeon]